MMKGIKRAFCTVEGVSVLSNHVTSPMQHSQVSGIENIERLIEVLGKDVASKGFLD